MTGCLILFTHVSKSVIRKSIFDVGLILQHLSRAVFSYCTHNAHNLNGACPYGIKYEDPWIICGIKQTMVIDQPFFFY